MFSKILVANRGEIAVRIIRACKEMGIATVAVYSTADKDALHVNLADESVCIGGPQAKDSYLNMDAIITAAINTKAQAIHPGYGFLSEKAKFAKLCETCNLIFIGPTADIIAKMGDKEQAKITMRNAGVPVIPGCDVIEDMQKAKDEARRVGYPLLIKARSGGGGRGIRHVKNEDEFENAFNMASSEAKASFGDGGVYLEKFLTKTKHIEVQLLCDHHGNVVCLGERDCSMQRKNQKMIEESPCAILRPETREKMLASTVKAARAVGYRNAGTIEYLLDQEGNFYFMEMNTRLQVEHPVTEMVTGIDLVKWQIRIAFGAAMDFSQKDVKFIGHAIECRINSENPYDNFKTSVGTIDVLHVPNGPWVRFDSAIYQGYAISPFYDSMIGKLIVCAKTREEALRKVQASLCEFVIEGVHTNVEYHIELISSEGFKNGSYCTDFLNK